MLKLNEQQIIIPMTKNKKNLFMLFCNNFLKLILTFNSTFQLIFAFLTFKNPFKKIYFYSIFS